MSPQELEGLVENIVYPIYALKLDDLITPCKLPSIRICESKVIKTPSTCTDIQMEKEKRAIDQD